jgi:alpha-amylase/alpha-mannosidase (GH57 family)
VGLDLVFLWHMHQPDYRDRVSGEFVLPWVYLHAIKDYSDMASHLERHPGVRAVVNFVPVLLDQIEDYCGQFASGRFRDPLLRLLATPDLDRILPHERALLFDTCFRANETTMLAAFPPYQRLHKLYLLLAAEGEEALGYLSGAYLSDLLTWYHLAWCGESVRREHAALGELMAKGHGFDAADRARLIAILSEVMHGIVPRYRALQDAGQVELSATPATHPLAPLLIDFQSAREAMPDAPLPESPRYPGGSERVAAHIEAAHKAHSRRFGHAPRGMWPAEGAVSTALARQLDAGGCRWAASGQGVLNNSLARHGPAEPDAAYRPWRVEGAPGLALFFRDERLSDLIGFEYAKWYGRDAAQHLIAQLEAIDQAQPAGSAAPLVSIILDGENAWEHYPYNGYYFFDDLYGLLEQHAAIRTTTYARWLADAATPSPQSFAELPGLVAGSWVYGTFSTWIGEPDKNRAWDLLCAAKHAYDAVLAGRTLSAEEADRAGAQLAVCESSDWFWWFGGYNPAQAVASFDQLYRRNLTNLYKLLKLNPPGNLGQPLSVGNTEARDGTMRRASENPS